MPAMLFIIGIIIFPLLYSVYISFFDFNIFTKHPPFIGLKNYIDIFKSDYFWYSIGRTTYFTVISVGLELVLGFLVALLLNQEFKGRSLARTLLILPWALPTVVNGVLWTWIYDPNYGALNALLKSLGIISQYKNWLGTAFSAMNAVIVADVWKNTSFIAMVLLAAMQNIPKDYYEAAIIDGASRLKNVFYITLPLLRPAILVAVVIRTMEAFKVFDIIYIMTKGGPANGTQVISYYTYINSFQYSKYGYGAALSYIVSLVILIFALFYIKILYKKS
ncbi:MAG: multiple sugar transport system permease protein [Thermoanaerobacteraceae bacterium]|jgi:ABC-type sugar transport system permease subunit|nr:multiple sugar transport system permease protein [Thermoanaerobacteraceae bacterium]